MNKQEATKIVEYFLASPETQDQVEAVLNYCAQLCAAVAKTHGFHNDEEDVLDIINDAESKLDFQSKPRQLEQWAEAQLLTAEFGRVMSECGEAIENIRKPGPDDKCNQYPGWHVEAIDVLIRVFDTLGKRGIKPGEIFVDKTLVNNGRAWKHNKNS